MSVTFVTSYLGQGLAAARPAAPNISVGAVGLWFSTDSGIFSVYASGAWKIIGSGTGGGGAVGANPAATAGPVAVNGSATTFMRSDGAPPVQKATAAQFGIVEVDGTTITASGGVISATAGSALVANFHPGYVAGRFYGPPGNVVISAFAGTTGTLWFTPMYIGVAKTFTKLSVRTNASVTGTPHAEIGIYANNSGIPGALLLDAGDVVLTSSATSTITGLNIPLTPGWYWLAVSIDASASLFGIPATLNSFWQGQTSISGGTSGYTQAWVFSTGNLPVVGALVDNTGISPSAWLSF